MSAKMLEVSLLRVETVLRLERDAWPMVKWLRQATNECALPPSPRPDSHRHLVFLAHRVGSFGIPTARR